MNTELRQIRDVLKQLVVSQARQADSLDAIKTNLLALRGVPAPAADPWRNMLEKFDLHGDLLSQWRGLFEAKADKIAKDIAATFNKHRDAGFEAPQLRPGDLTKAFGNGVTLPQPFNPETLDYFAGASKGGFTEYDFQGNKRQSTPDTLNLWDTTIQTDGFALQKTTSAIDAYIPSSQLPNLSLNKVDLQVNAYRADLGIVAWASFYTQPFEIPFLCYPIRDGQMMWIGQLFSRDMQPVAGDMFLVSLKWQGKPDGNDAFQMATFTFMIDGERGDATPAQETVRKGTFVIEGPAHDVLAKRLKDHKAELIDLRKKFAGAAADLASAVSKAFDSHRATGAFETAPLRADELKTAFLDQAYHQDFQPDDFDQFAGQWTAQFRMYGRDGVQQGWFPQYVTWHETYTGAGGEYLQRVCGSGVRRFDPLRLPDLALRQVDLVLDAFEPDCGMVSWASKYTPIRMEIPLIAYKLGANRYLWISRRLDERLQVLGPPGTLDIALEWIVKSGPKRTYYLVNDTFEIDFLAGTAQPFGPMFLKGKFYE